MKPRLRCEWANADSVCAHYHDTEWGVPTRDPQALFERLTLESMQAGLSWLTVLNKREAMRRAFHGFDPKALAEVADIEKLDWLKDSGLIRHRGKLNGMIANARIFDEMIEPGRFLWSFVSDTPIQNGWRQGTDVPSKTERSKKMSRALKELGFIFVGPTTCYSFMQSAGLVNDHVVSCYRHAEVSCANSLASTRQEG